MSEESWVRVPVGLDAGRWRTRRTTRTVLVAVHTLVAGQRLLDVVGLVESDPRVQVVYTAAPDVFGGAVPEFLRAQDAVVVPWEQAVRERFDLALAAAYGGIAQVHAPVMVLPHGAGYGKRAPSAVGARAVAAEVYGLGRDQLVAEGRVVPASIILSHDAQREVLAAQCPAALPIAVVAGDPCYDRLRASVRLRAEYRAALGVGAGQRLVVVASTWGSDALFGRCPELVAEVPRALDPARYRVAALFHPAAWAHGSRQLRAWLGAARAAGLVLVEPGVDWRGVVVAADQVIGDHGSTTSYAASIGRPVLYVDAGGAELTSGSAQGYVREHAPRWRPGVGVEEQLPVTVPAGWARAVGARLTGRPGRAHRLIRREMYRLLELSEPATAPVVEPAALPLVGVGRG